MDKYLNYNREDNKKLMQIIDDLMELRSYTRKYIPDFQIPFADSKNILDGFEEIAKNLIPMLQKLGILDDNSSKINYPSKKIKLQQFTADQTNLENYTEITRASDLLDASENNIVLVSSNSAKKKLKSIGIEPQNIKSSGGPLFIEDYSKLDTKLPENALIGIKKKLIKLMEELRINIKENKKVLFIYSPEDITDNINLERVAELKTEYGENFKVVKIPSWNQI